MNDNDNINNNKSDIIASSAALSDDVVIDLNRNKNRTKITMPMNANTKEYEETDGNVNLLLNNKPKVFCESKQLELNDSDEYERFTSDDEMDDVECCSNLQQLQHQPPQQMDFDDDEIGDLSGEDDAAIKNELERIDCVERDNDFNENINCDLATYLQQYDYKMDLKKSYQLDNERECLTDEDNNSKLPTPDIIIEHNNSNNGKLQNDAATVVDDEKINDDKEKDNEEPDLIKNITATGVRADEINSKDNNNDVDGGNEISSPVEHEIPIATTNHDDVKIINQIQTEFCASTTIVANTSTKLSFDSATSAVVDIIGDFGKEVEKEIGLIVSGYLNAKMDAPSAGDSPSSINIDNFRPSVEEEEENVFDENKFIEHLRSFSKVSAVLQLLSIVYHS
jgi:hypothetical protein